VIADAIKPVYNSDNKFISERNRAYHLRPPPERDRDVVIDNDINLERPDVSYYLDRYIKIYLD